MKTIVIISVIVLLSSSTFLILTNKEIDNAATLKTEEIALLQNNSTSFHDLVEFNNDELQLKNEVIQFKITFHQKDVVDVTVKTVAYYVDETMTAAYCLLTDGEKPLINSSCTCYIPERKYLVVTPKMRVSIGKWWIAKLLKDKIGQSSNDSKQFNVQAGESWYLTLAVPTSSEKSYFSLIFRSINDSMEVTQLTRHRNVGLYSPSFNQFSGKYYAIKFSFLGGASICDISKEITVREGSIIHLVVAGQNKGEILVDLPNGEKTQFSQGGIITYIFLGNETGNWKFTVNGWSLYFRMAIMLLYIDIDPHVKGL
jgi:hypothetical protein